MDGVNISDYGLDDLRSRLTIIPQVIGSLRRLFKTGVNM